jgi:microsomal dipeptidase-like Zn-dependent dipeptidase
MTAKFLKAAALVLAVAALIWAVPRVTDRAYNKVVRPSEPFAVSEQARALHATLRIADLHADSLLWPRDLLARGTAGQVDVPRLAEGRVAVQIFGAPTEFPFGRNFKGNSAGAFDMITPLVITSGWEPGTWNSRLARAKHMADVLRRAAESSNGRLSLISRRGDLDGFLDAWSHDQQRTAAFMGLEGMHALEGRIEALDELYASGYRMIGFSHFIDNDFAGSSTGEEKHGLTLLGRAALARMEELGMIADLAHASPATIRDVSALARKPVVVSHTGVQATCPGPRNLSDDEIRLVAGTGGMIGIGVFPHAVCDTSPRATARAMRHVRDLVGIEHVALGTDFDGGVTTSFDASEILVLVAALLDEGFTPEQIRLVLGENSLTFLRKWLPG